MNFPSWMASYFKSPIWILTKGEQGIIDSVWLEEPRAHARFDVLLKTGMRFNVPTLLKCQPDSVNGTQVVRVCEYNPTTGEVVEVLGGM